MTDGVPTFSEALQQTVSLPLSEGDVPECPISFLNLAESGDGDPDDGNLRIDFDEILVSDKASEGVDSQNYGESAVFASDFDEDIDTSFGDNSTETDSSDMLYMQIHGVQLKNYESDAPKTNYSDEIDGLPDLEDKSSTREEDVDGVEKYTPMFKKSDGGVKNNSSDGYDVTVEAAVLAALNAKEEAERIGDGLNSTDIAQTTPYDRIVRESIISSLRKTEISSPHRELTNEDVRTLVTLGYNDELDTMADPVEIGRIAYDTEKQAAQAENEVKAEFERNTQIGTFLRRYDIRRIKTYARFVVCIISAILLFFLENYHIFGLSGIGTLSYTASPIQYSVSCLVLVAVCVAISWKQLYKGIRSMVSFEPDQYSVSVIMIALTLIYDMAMPLISMGDNIARINAPTAICLAISAFCDGINIQRERKTFLTLVSAEVDDSRDSNGANLFCAEEIKARMAENRRGRSALGIENSSDCGVYRIKNAEFIEGYFERTSRTAPYNRILNLLLVSCLILSVINPAISIWLNGDVAEAVGVYFITVAYCMPLSTLVFSCLPMFLASRELNRRGCGIIGDASAQEYSQNNEFIFDSKEHIHIRRNDESGSFVRFYGTKGEDMQRYMYLTNRFFESIGVSFDTLIDTSGGDLEYASEYRNTNMKTDIIEVSENGIDAYLNSSVHIIAGDISYMKKKGIRVPQESLDRIILRRDNCSVMYVAFDNKLKIRYELTYTVIAEFERMVSRLSRYGARFSVRTYDPNINKRFYKKIRSGKSFGIGIIKPDNLEYNCDRVDSGIFAVGSARNIAYPLEYCNLVTKAQRRGKIFRILASAASMALTCWLTCIGHLCNYGSLFIVLHHIVWGAVAVFITYKTVGDNGKQKNKK